MPEPIVVLRWVIVLAVLLGIFFYLTLKRHRSIRIVYNLLMKANLILMYPVGFVLLFLFPLWIGIWIGFEIVIAMTGRMDLVLPPFYLNLENLVDLLTPYAAGLMAIFIIALRLPAGLLKEGTKISYEKFGRLQWWGRATRSMKERWQWLPTVQGLFMPYLSEKAGRGEIRGVSPTANAGEDEYKIAHALADHFNVPVFMQASDFAEMDHRDTERKGLVDFKYIPGLDAGELPLVLDRPVHFIWDMKGYLWYNATTFNPFKKRKRTNEALEMYHSLLEDDGIILIDAAVRRTTLQVLNEIIISFVPWMFYYGEGSTFDRVASVIRRRSDLFSVQLAGEGKYRIAIIQKHTIGVARREAV
ncbi:hypothetical protein [Cohnella soli]|uniref:Uncharacterized protein n=1 Tax=Cohnella soli TaxID=425005 RepID=A0ABW0HMR2_9BACL